MKPTIVLTLIGPDRPGLVEQVAHAIESCGGNWLESRLAHLGGQFAGIVRAEVPEEYRTRVAEHLASLWSSGLQVTVQPDELPAGPQGGVAVRLELVGHDRPGIVRRITAKLAASGVNVEEMETDCVPAPMTGEPLFRAQALLRLPDTVTLPALQAELEKISHDLMVELKLEKA